MYFIRPISIHRTVAESFRNSFYPIIRLKQSINYTLVPTLNEKDLEEQFVRGDGPGGQSVAKTSNCVILKHKPTGIIVRCHETRSLDQNRKKARSLLITKLDNLINEEKSVEMQRKAIESKRQQSRIRKNSKLRKLKEEWKQREKLE